MAINVLLVEDDELLVKRIQNHFTDTEFSIEIDPTGADALNIVRQRVNLRSAISLAIIDIVLPKRDGLQLAKELRKVLALGSRQKFVHVWVLGGILSHRIHQASEVFNLHV